MPRKAGTGKSRAKRPVIYTNWYLREWMDALGVNQATMSERTGWTKTKASHLYNSQQDHSSVVLDEAARALNCQAYELLMRYEAAMALRRQREDAVKIVADTEMLRATGTDGR